MLSLCCFFWCWFCYFFCYLLLSPIHQHSKQNARLVVGITNTPDKTDSNRIRKQMHALARAARPASDATYGGDNSPPTFLYGWLDGVEFKDFLEQYGIHESSLPQVMVFDAPKEKYYHEPDVKVTAQGISEFVQTVADGTAFPKAQGFWGYLDTVVRAFHDFYPWSIGVALSWVALVVYCMWQCKRCVCGECDDDEEDEEFQEYMKERKAMNKVKTM